ncbi:hypothetical protein C8N35_1034 [Breoghania corrubedonensis]|uniref:Molybdopterin synthase sulfur carrier subunit n=1 Tax=Breoghania corrubedonensis TaxID=665038 RepID=A0A2T5VAP4_9HYPH|nr:hypothetical protein [Breoghania corrubedonensis]PTW60825.1 hypothetical protein C8N35_1034 [Breoghania corrubedonensis]
MSETNLTSPVGTRRIQLRAGLVERAAMPFLDIPVPAQASAAALRAGIAEAYPELADVLGGCLLIAGDRVLGEDETVSAGMPLALVPPMRGG